MRLEPNRFLKKFPTWFTPMEWGAPLALAVLAGLITAAFLTGMFPLPSAFAFLESLPAIYQTLDSLGAFTMLAASFLVSSTLAAATMTAVIRICFYPFVKDLAQYNITGNAHLHSFEKILEEQKERQVSDLEAALVKTDQKLQEQVGATQTAQEARKKAENQLHLFQLKQAQSSNDSTQPSASRPVEQVSKSVPNTPNLPRATPN